MSIKEILKKLQPTGIRSQLILGIAIVIVVLMSLFVMELVNRQKAFFLELNHDRAMGLSIGLANTANSYVISFELARLQKLVSTYKDIPGIEYAIITSDDGTVLSHTDKKFLGLKATDSVSTKLKQVKETQVLLEDNNILDIATPIVNRDEIVGWARIGVSQKYIEPTITGIKLKGLLYIFISLIVGSVFAVIVAAGLSRGLKKLVTAAQQIKAGNRGLRVGPSRSEEISQLGTAFNQMLDEISANEKLLSNVLENMPVGVFILDECGKVVTVNPAGQQIWQGVKYVEADEYSQYKAWFTDTGKMVEAHEWGAAIALAENKEVLNQEVEIECFDNTRKIIINSALPLHDTNGKTIGLLVTNVDITARKNAENKLRKSNHDIGERVKELRCLYRMSELANQSDKTMHDIVNECVDIIPPSYQFPDITCARIEFEGQMFESANFAETGLKQEQIIISRGIEIGKVQVYYKQQRPEEAEGPFLAEERLLINSIADILGSTAERKNAEKELVKSEEKHRALVENISDAIVLVDKDRKVIYRSPSVERLTGYTNEESESMDMLDFINTDEMEATLASFQKSLNSPGVPVHFTTRLRHKNGHLLCVEGTTRDLFHNGNIQALVTNFRDITEKKRATELFKHQFENSPDLIVIINKDFSIESINRSRLNGPTTAELVGMNSIEVLPEESRAIAKEGILRCFETGKNIEIENALKGGMWVRSRFVPIVIDGNIQHIMVIATDITERKLAEDNLKQSEEKNRALIENITDAIMLLDESFTNIYQSPSVERIIGYAMEDDTSKRALDFIHPEDLSIGADFFSKSARAPGIAFSSQFRVKHKQGHYIWIEGTVINLLQNESVKAYIVNYRDITERKKAEEQQALITSIVNSSDDAIISKSLDGMVTSWNRGAEKVLGYSAHEMIGQSITKLIPIDLKGEENTISTQIVRGLSVDHYETRRMRKDGEIIYVSLTISPIRDSLGKIVGSSKILRDISESKKAEEEIKALNEGLELKVEERTRELQDTNRELEAFSYTVSHDLQAPLRVINGYGKLLLRTHAETLNDEGKEFITVMNDKASHMSQLIKDLLEFSKFGKAPLNKKEVNMNEMVRVIADEIKLANYSAKTQFVFTDLPPATCDPVLMWQVWQNLIANGVKYSSKKENSVVQIGAEKQLDSIVYYVKDNGAGFDMKHADKLFGVFKRLHTSTEFEGTGVGLATVARIVSKHGGRIWAEAKVGEGAAFYFTLG